MSAEVDAAEAPESVEGRRLPVGVIVTVVVVALVVAVTATPAVYVRLEHGYWLMGLLLMPVGALIAGGLIAMLRYFAAQP